MNIPTNKEIFFELYLRNRPTATPDEIAEWWDKVDVGGETAAELAGKGYTPDLVVARIAAAPVRWEDQRDEEAAVDAMLYGPDVS